MAYNEDRCGSDDFQGHRFEPPLAAHLILFKLCRAINTKIR